MDNVMKQIKLKKGILTVPCCYHCPMYLEEWYGGCQGSGLRDVENNQIVQDWCPLEDSNE